MIPWPKLIDRRRFKEIAGDDVEQLQTLIALFDEQSQENLLNMQEALWENDVERYVRAVHDLKNLGRNIASNRLIKHSQMLEKLASEPMLETASKKMAETNALLAKAMEELRAIQRKWS